jgi:signal transduction histidine kinase
METLIQTFIEMCQWDNAKFLIFSDNVFGTLIYYSHFFALILALFVGFFVLFKDRKNLINVLLFLIMINFSIWIFLDLVLWANEKIHLIMFFWSIILIIEPLIYALCVYFIDVFIEKKDISLKKKIGIFSLLLPIILLLPSSLTLTGFDLTNCYREPIEGFIATYYIYFIEIVYVVWIIIFAIKKYKETITKFKKEILFITLGVLLFLFSFTSGNIIGSLTENWTLAQIGFLGMPIFVAFLLYMVVKFKSFNTKFFLTQVLIFSLSLSVLALLFIRKIENVRVVVIFTLLFVILVGYSLIKSVRREVEQRERLENLRLRLEESNLNLGIANDKLEDLSKLKSEFVSLASHQLRSPLTAIKGYTSMLMQGDYGEINKEAKETIGKVMESSNNLSLVVEDLLNVSKIEQGGMKYEMTQFDFTQLINNTIENLSITAKQKNLELINNIPKESKYLINGDKEKLRQVLINLIDNSIKYTPTGQIEVSLSENDNKITLKIKDTGVGIDEKIIKTLFEKFSRGEGGRLNSSGSGLGLYLAKEIIEAHHGRIWVESEGKGKGSTFFVEMTQVE